MAAAKRAKARSRATVELPLVDLQRAVRALCQRKYREAFGHSWKTARPFWARSWAAAPAFGGSAMRRAHLVRWVDSHAVSSSAFRHRQVSVRDVAIVSLLAGNLPAMRVTPQTTAKDVLDVEEAYVRDAMHRQA